MITIEKIVTEDDIKKIVFDIQQAEWAAASEISADDYSVESLKAFLETPNTVFIIAHLDGQFAGMASAKLLNKPTGDLWLYIDEVDVCVNMQKQGVGTEMMQYLLQFASEFGCEEVWIGTEVDNVPANKLYQSLHPTEVEQFVGYAFDLRRLNL